MGYNFAIGEWRQVKPAESEPAEYIVWPDETRLPNAPVSPANDGSNSWNPSYSAWAEFSRRNGLYDLFFGPGSLIESHPGWAELKREHLTRFSEAERKLALLRNRNNEEDYDLERLDWLVFWTRWALENCKRPIFANL